MNRSEFLEKLSSAIKTKGDWFNSKELPQLLENFRIMHICIKNVFDLLVKRGLIVPDPYKNDKKISSIQAPSDEPYIETDSASVIGSRLSDYESMVEFICSYFKFSVENLDLKKIKNLTELVNSFQWGNLSPNSTRPNTRGLAILIISLRKGLPAISVSMLNDSLSKSSKAYMEIVRALKGISDYKREEYKFKIRNEIMGLSNFPINNIDSPSQEVAEIKKLFPSVMGKSPCYTELLNEIAAEDFEANADALQNNVLAKLEIREEKKKVEKEVIDTKLVLLDVVRTMLSIAPTYSVIVEKISNNSNILEMSKNTVMEKLKKNLRKAFKIKEPPVIYKFIIIDKKNDSKTMREVEINAFISNIEKKANFYLALANKNSTEYKKIAAADEDTLLQFINRQMSESKELATLITAADEYFKTNALPTDRSKIKGLKMDIMSANNIIVKANKKRAEYLSYIEEQAQMKKLGIKDE